MVVPLLDAREQAVREAAAAERRRMERDLHDGVQQHLVALRLRIGLLDARLADGPGEVREALEDILTQVELAIDEVRRVGRGECARVLGREGLRGALRDATACAGAVVHLEGVTTERMPAPAEQALYFTIREAVCNAMKHGEQTAPITVTARVLGATAVFEVSDVADPHAPEIPASVPRTIAERAAALGGTAQAFSSSSGGRRVLGSLPLTGRKGDARHGHC